LLYPAELQAHVRKKNDFKYHMLEFMSTKKMWTDKSVRFFQDQDTDIYFFVIR
jgi:hypothetical protein